MHYKWLRFALQPDCDECDEIDAPKGGSGICRVRRSRPPQPLPHHWYLSYGSFIVWSFTAWQIALTWPCCYYEITTLLYRRHTDSTHIGPTKRNFNTILRSGWRTTGDHPDSVSAFTWQWMEWCSVTWIAFSARKDVTIEGLCQRVRRFPPMDTRDTNTSWIVPISPQDCDRISARITE